MMHAFSSSTRPGLQERVPGLTQKLERNPVTKKEQTNKKSIT